MPKRSPGTCSQPLGELRGQIIYMVILGEKKRTVKSRTRVTLAWVTQRFDKSRRHPGHGKETGKGCLRVSR